METAALLNHYRFAVTRDELMMQLLARLFRDGPLDDQTIEVEFEHQIGEVRKKLTELFRASFVRLSGSRWATTELANHVLAKLGVAKLTARSLLAKQEIAPYDFEFLDA